MRSSRFAYQTATPGHRPKHLAANHRRRMQTVIFDNHAACLELLDDYDACGSDWRLEGFGRPNPHFSGNFWWANARYLQTLPEPRSLNTRDRYQAEFWIGKNSSLRPFELVYPTDPFARPSAWMGLESRYQRLIEGIGPIRRIVDLGIDYGFSTFHLARDFPEADVLGIDTFPLHADAEAWVRSHLLCFPNLRIQTGPAAAIGRQFQGSIDLLHLDGEPDYDRLAETFHAWRDHMRPGGAVLFHDTQIFAGVRRLFDELPGTKTEIREHYGLGYWIKE